MDEGLRACLLGILQRGITEARSCALAGEANKAADLLDALDNIPRHLARWTESSEREIQDQLGAFDRSHPNHQTSYQSSFEERAVFL
jgi:hypothetical protein